MELVFVWLQFVAMLVMSCHVYTQGGVYLYSISTQGGVYVYSINYLAVPISLHSQGGGLFGENTVSLLLYLANALICSTSQEVLQLPNVLAAFLPSFPISHPPPISLGSQCRPVRLVIVIELQFSTRLDEQLLCRDKVDVMRLELHLLSRDRVDEWRDELEEGVDIPRY